MEKAEARKALLKYFTLYDRKNHWIVECDTCDARWSLAFKASGIHPGNVLHLLNHAYGHKKKEVATR